MREIKEGRKRELDSEVLDIIFFFFVAVIFEARCLEANGKQEEGAEG